MVKNTKGEVTTYKGNTVGDESLLGSDGKLCRGCENAVGYTSIFVSTGDEITVNFLNIAGSVYGYPGIYLPNPVIQGLQRGSRKPTGRMDVIDGTCRNLFVQERCVETTSCPP